MNNVRRLSFVASIVVLLIMQMRLFRWFKDFTKNATTTVLSNGVPLNGTLRQTQEGRSLGFLVDNNHTTTNNNKTAEKEDAINSSSTITVNENTSSNLSSSSNISSSNISTIANVIDVAVSSEMPQEVTTNTTTTNTTNTNTVTNTEIPHHNESVAVPPPPPPAAVSILHHCDMIEENNHNNTNKTQSSFWNQTRFENIVDDPRLTVESWHSTLLDPWPVIHQSICFNNSQFVNDHGNQQTATTAVVDDDVWQVRLLYLGMYLHQHMPALKAMEARKACQQRQQEQQQAQQQQGQPPPVANKNRTNNNDYLCDPETKFLVASLAGVGSGATFRNAVVPALLAGLSSGRVVLFVSHRPYGNLQMQEEWRLASCPRGDYQCFFLPLTPCTLTDDEIKVAAERPNTTSMWDVMNNETNYIAVEHERVVVIETVPVPAEPVHDAELRIRERIYGLVNATAHKYQAPSHVVQDILRKTYHQQYEIQRQSNRSKYHYGLQLDHATSTLHQAALLYIFRPNSKFRQLLEEEFQSAVPQDLDPEWSFGLPIRASDKCGSESMCLKFDQYMQLTRQQYHKYTNGTKTASIVLTSETASILARRHNYSASADFPFRFIVNDKDAGQGHGTPALYGDKGGPDADKVMLSTIVTLKMQLMAKYTVVNCCSSFHRVLLDMLRSGCGLAAEPEFRCLQETEDPQFHLCCAWSKDERCQTAFQEFRDLFQNATHEYTRI